MKRTTAPPKTAGLGSYGLLTLTWLLTSPLAAEPTGPDAEGSVDVVLETARSQLQQGELEHAVAMLVDLRKGGGLSSKELARSYLLEGMGRALLDDPQADRAFSIALRLDSSSDPGVQQRAIREPFSATQASLPPPSQTLNAIATSRPSTGGLQAGVRVELLADDLGLVSGVLVDEHPVALSATTPLVFAPHEAPEGASILLLDEFGNQLRTVPLVPASSSTNEKSQAAPRASAAAQNAEEQDPWLGTERFRGERWGVSNWPWVTLAGGVVGAAGVAVIVGSGAAIAIVDRGTALSSELTPMVQPALFVSLGLGVLFVAAGGATIVTDQIIRKELWKPEADRDTNTADDKPVAQALSALSG